MISTQKLIVTFFFRTTSRLKKQFEEYCYLGCLLLYSHGTCRSHSNLPTLKKVEAMARTNRLQNL